jgi:hypothetical protein
MPGIHRCALDVYKVQHDVRVQRCEYDVKQIAGADRVAVNH